ncbi:MAG: hypothetical protein CL758_06685 [Chloroflexi bacterium]|nr:hypothetical protein [Chloroflexota bacterium]|tara:strand:+ start:455 stop:709 length:255 start_codon:yes stop_codon:yes gene_type:complete
MIKNKFILILNSPLSWGLLAFPIGFILGVTQLSVWLLTILLAGFIIFVMFQKPATSFNEGKIFAPAGIVIFSWLIGFILKGIIF